MMLKMIELDWDKMEGLIPAIIQDDNTEQVLMLGYMNKESLERTISSSLVTFWSRSQNKIWTKGETSGHVLQVISVHTDCDRDTILVRVNPNGPTCHMGTVSCFENLHKNPAVFLHELERVIKSRHTTMPEGSYTTQLFHDGKARIAQKVGEEGVEVAIAHMKGNKEELCGEVADLFYHALVLLEDAGLGISDITNVLEKRHKK